MVEIRSERAEDAEARIKKETTARYIAEKRTDNAEVALAEVLAEIERLNQNN